MSNNCYTGCPPRMADGRHFTDYRPQCEQNGLLQGHTSSYQYRQYLIQNAEKIMNENRRYVLDTVGNKNCKMPYHDGTMLPEKYVQTCEKDSCTLRLVNPNGVGIGRRHNENYEACKYLPFVNKAGSNCCEDDKRPALSVPVERDLMNYQARAVDPVPFNLTK